QVMLKEIVSDGLYPITSKWRPYVLVALLTNKVSINLWHARLGHPHFKVLQSVSLFTTQQ
ncbi:GAG-pre-integrase domain-containing protein, partial [Salmonella sp. gx-f5]|uniref:GAG-pre-integrase domain-containing protein n=1 Tax=Salmonella sp. gx-f5 TaxID=2582605 RepID=UPI0013737BDC